MTYQTTEYRGYTIDIDYDQDAECPWHSWDGCTPLLAYTSDGVRPYGDIPTGVPELTRGDLQTVLSAEKMLEYTTGYTTWQKLREDWPTWHSPSMLDAYQLAVEHYFDGLSNTDKLDLLHTIYHDVKGWPAYLCARNGYYQRDWAELLIVCTPEFAKAMGIKGPVSIDSLKGEADLWAAWAYGDVYGYNIEEIDDSCWGFYGSDHDKSGLMEYATNAIDCHIEHKRKARIEKLKELVRNHVPLYKRPQILEGI